MKRCFFSICACFLAVQTAHAQEIGYVESFALAGDRNAAVKQLIPGTEDYYFYLCVHLQNTEQFEQVAQLTQTWIQRHGETPRVKQILNRQALLTYEKTPEQSLQYLQRELQLQFGHQKEQVDAPGRLPTNLDPKSIGRKTLTAAALGDLTNLDRFEEPALEWLAAQKLHPNHRRALLKRATRPDLPNLIPLLLEDLAQAPNLNFQDYPIHRRLLLAQLDELLAKRPELRNQQAFVQVYLAKLAPGNDVATRFDRVEQLAYLERLWKFVSTLAPAHNSLKTHVLFYRLVHDRAEGKYDRARFVEYLKLPRAVPYISRVLMEAAENRPFPADLQADFSPLTSLPPVMNDEPLVRDYLQHFFVDEANFKAFEPYLSDEYLKRQFAETKIVNGLGEPEQWYALLNPAEYQALKERVDLDFAPSNKTRFNADEPVTLHVDVKNVATLIVKVFEINTKSFYRERQAEINTDINLDGLIANQERTEKYGEPPLRRVRRKFDFPTLNKSGVYVVDFIGNGKSSRVLIRKGQLSVLEQPHPAGQMLTVLDEKRNVVRDASIWLGGREFKARDDATILIPFSTQPGSLPITICQGDFCSLGRLEHQSESYQLQAAIFVERESLLTRRVAQVIVRPSLQLNGNPMGVGALEDVQLRMTSTDLDGISTTKTVDRFELFEDRESTYEFRVPERLNRLQFELHAKVRNLSQDKKVDLAATEAFVVNETMRSEHISDLHLASVGGKYVLELLGRSGESRANRPIQLALKHRDFRDPVQVTLQTNDHGHVVLGDLTDLVSLHATSPEGIQRSWNLEGRENDLGRSGLHAVAGEPVAIPYYSKRDKPQRDELAFFELRGDAPIHDRFELLGFQDGLLKIKGLAPGDYQLDLKRSPHASGRSVRIRVGRGEKRGGFVVGDYRRLQLNESAPLAISQALVKDGKLIVQLANSTKFARVHVFASRYVPGIPPAKLAGIPESPRFWMLVPPVESAYVVGRNIGDEYRYILERKYSHKFPGNMLERPALLLNPWPVRQAETGQQVATGGDAFAPAAAPADAAMRAEKQAGGGGIAGVGSVSLEFLAGTSAVLVNLAPDENGALSVPVESLLGRQDIRVVAADTQSTAIRSVSLGETNAKTLDLRLAKGLDSAKHFVQQRRITILDQGGQLVLPDVSSSRVEWIDSLTKAYGLFRTLNSDAKLIQFEFILKWPKLKPEEKRDYYSRFACHELNVFLLKKDPEFFESVIQPYLQNKKDKTYLDHWLLGNDLSRFQSPWQFAQLNVAERILLGQRLPAESAITRRHVKDLFDLLPPAPEQFQAWFDTVLKASAFDGVAALGIELSDEGVVMLGGVKTQVNFEQAGAAGRPPAPPAPEAPAAAYGKATELKRKSGMTAPPKPAGEPGVDKRLAARLNRDGAEKAEAFYSRLEERGLAREQLFRQVDKTQEWAENNYYQLPIDQQVPQLVVANAFWNEYAAHDAKQPFRSRHLAAATSSFTEIMFALAVLDLPFEAGEHDTKIEGTQMTLTMASPAIVFHEEVRPAEQPAEKTPILISENFFQRDQRYRTVNNEQVDNFVTAEFVTHRVYGAQVVVTNPTSSRQRLDVLTQVPQGAIPVLGGKYTDNDPLTLEPFHTQTLEYHFYFPGAGEFAHFPVHVSKEQQLVASANAFRFKVVDKPTQFDRQSWDFVSQQGTDEEVLDYLKRENLNRIALDRIAFRMADRAFFQATIDILRTRHFFHPTLWSYAVRHNVPVAIQEYLSHRDDFVARCGPLRSSILMIDPVERKFYEHLEYRPLVNARAHQLGRQRQIVNARLHAQYHRLLEQLCFQRELSADDWMAISYYMLVQDRIQESLDAFAKVDVNRIETRIQYDYLAAYLDLFTDTHESARGIAEKYAEHPVDRWRNAFAVIRSQLDEIDGAKPTVVDPENREQQQTRLAADQPSFEFEIEGKQVNVSYQNVEHLVVNYYRMDVELLFSRNPFVRDFSSGFSYIRPNLVQTLDVPKQKTGTSFTLPESLQTANVLVEITADGKSQTRPYYSNALVTRVEENFGQIKVVRADNSHAIAKAYVKVYAKLKDGRVEFFKDGYTDHRGRFDYSSLSTNLLDTVDRFSVLVMTDDFGATVKEIAPPAR